jgi:hypothetical protein
MKTVTNGLEKPRYTYLENKVSNNCTTYEIIYYFSSSYQLDFMKHYNKLNTGSVNALQLHVVCDTTFIGSVLGYKIFFGGFVFSRGFSLVVRQKPPTFKNLNLHI